MGLSVLIGKAVYHITFYYTRLGLCLQKIIQYTGKRLFPEEQPFGHEPIATSLGLGPFYFLLNSYTSGRRLGSVNVLWRTCWM